MPSSDQFESQVVHDVDAAERLRKELKSRGGPTAYEISLHATDAERRELIEQSNWSRDRHQQSMHVSSSPGLFALRVEAVELTARGVGKPIYFYFSKHARLPPLTMTEDADEQDLYLVNYQAPTYAPLKDAKVGDSPTINGRRWSVRSIVRVGIEEFSVLRHIDVQVPTGLDAFFEAKRDQKTIVVLKEAPAPSGISIPADQAHDSSAIATSAGVSEAIPSPARHGLSSTVTHADRYGSSIAFALDADQEAALRSHAGDGTVVIVGPPGTGKTTVALMRGSFLLTSLLDENGGLKPGKPPLRRERMALFVVTQHLENYLKSFLASDEVAIHGVKVINLRGTYLKQLFRDPTLKMWRAGLHLRTSDDYPESPSLTYIKSCPQILNLAFFHALQQATINGGESWNAVIDRMRNRLSKLQRTDKTDLLLSHVRTFLARWASRMGEAAVDSLGGAPQWLIATRSDLQMSVFCDGFPWNPASPWRQMEDVVWRELVNLIDPKDILLAVISDYRTSGDRKDLRTAGLTDIEIDGALSEWHAVLTGEDGADEEEPDEEPGTAEQTVEDGAQPSRKGALTLTDLPILACIARALLAPAAKRSPGWTPDVLPQGTVPESGMIGYTRLGMLLPEDLPRYDHVMIDEAQDLSYPELCFAMACTEPVLGASTVAGDPYQRMRWENGLASLELLRPGVGRRFEVQCNYRQTADLMKWVSRLAKALYPDHQLSGKASARRGSSPTVECVDRPEKAAPRISQHIKAWYKATREPFVAVLLIGYESQASLGLVKALRNRLEDLDVKFFEDGNLIQRGTVSVAEVPSVKGLEFDAVVVSVSAAACAQLDSGDPRAVHIRNQLYVACTRASNQLAVVFQGRPQLLSDFLPAT